MYLAFSVATTTFMADATGLSFGRVMLTFYTETAAVTKWRSPAVGSAAVTRTYSDVL
jgi:hypothetical protein